MTKCWCYRIVSQKLNILTVFWILSLNKLLQSMKIEHLLTSVCHLWSNESLQWWRNELQTSQCCPDEEHKFSEFCLGNWIFEASLKSSFTTPVMYWVIVWSHLLSKNLTTCQVVRSRADVEWTSNTDSGAVWIRDTRFQGLMITLICWWTLLYFSFVFLFFLFLYFPLPLFSSFFFFWSFLVFIYISGI